MSASSSSRRLLRGVDVRVRMVSDLVAALEDRLRLVRKRLDRVARDEERRANAVALEQVEHARHADARAVLAAREHRRGRALVAEPHRERIEIEATADRARRHRGDANHRASATLSWSSDGGFWGHRGQRRRGGWAGAARGGRRGRRGRVVLPKGPTERRTLRPGAEVVTTPRARPADRRARDARSTSCSTRSYPPRSSESSRCARCRSSRVASAPASRGESGPRRPAGVPVLPQRRAFHTLDGQLLVPAGDERRAPSSTPLRRRRFGPLAITAVLQAGRRTLAHRLVRAVGLVRAADEDAKVVAQPDFTPFAEGRGKAQLSRAGCWFPQPVLALIVLVPIGRRAAALRRACARCVRPGDVSSRAATPLD